MDIKEFYQKKKKHYLRLSGQSNDRKENSNPRIRIGGLKSPQRLQKLKSEGVSSILTFSWGWFSAAIAIRERREKRERGAKKDGEREREGAKIGIRKGLLKRGD